MEELKTPERIESFSKKRPTFTLQWHLTNACPNNCKHCYNDRHNQPLSLIDTKKIVDDFGYLLKRWNCNGGIYFTGGDPLLYPNFYDLLKYTRSQIPEVMIGILGNPELLTEETIEVLKEQDVHSYQMSIDGLEKTHDYFRHPGSFKNTLEKLNLLREMGIKTMVMSTVSRVNIKELPELINVIVENKIDFFDFRRLVPIGRGKRLERESIISPREYRNFLQEMDKMYEKYRGEKTLFETGDPLWRLFYFEEGKIQRVKNSNLVWSGCMIGCDGVTILENGIVLACRRLPILIGKVPAQKIRDIFVRSPSLNEMRKIEKIKKCQDCELLLQCRGCRAVANALKNDYFAEDPQCWRN